jgi:MarR family transcriptional regulator, transcriptional regulator for hemolysin
VRLSEANGSAAVDGVRSFFCTAPLNKPAHYIISMLMLSLAQKWTVSPARELGFALHDVARLLRTYSDQRARELGTTRAQWAVLSRLQRCEGAKQNELAEALDLAPITVGRLLDKLTAAGLVERRDDATDRRANRLYLTAKAAPALKDLGALAEDLMGRALAGLDEGDIRAMQDSLATMKANLKTELSLGAYAK